MASETKQVDLLQKFIDNEKKAKTWTIMSVTLFCLLAFGLIYLAWKLKTAETTISSQQLKIQELNIALTAALARADSANEVLTSENKNLEKRNINYDSLQNLANSLLINLAEIKRINPNENVVTQNTAVIDKPTQTTIEKMITPASIEKIQEKENKYTIYIQFTGDFKDQAYYLQQKWQNKYICPQPELINNRSFAATVKYFYAEDEAEAKKIAKITEDRIGFPVQVSFQKMKAPRHQLELWIGKYQPKTTDEIFKKYDIKKELLNKAVIQKQIQDVKAK